MFHLTVTWMFRDMVQLTSIEHSSCSPESFSLTGRYRAVIVLLRSGCVSLEQAFLAVYWFRWKMRCSRKSGNRPCQCCLACDRPSMVSKRLVMTTSSSDEAVWTPTRSLNLFESTSFEDVSSVLHVLPAEADEEAASASAVQALFCGPVLLHATARDQIVQMLRISYWWLVLLLCI